jgi:RNA polymerase sigma-70 factor (ECF subfamily)
MAPEASWARTPDDADFFQREAQAAGSLVVTRPPPYLQPLQRPGQALCDRADDELMTLAQAGARDAFGVLVERHALRVVHVCARLLNDAELGVELAQETWVTVWTQRAHYRREGKFVVWLVTVARNRCRNRLRQQGVVRRHIESNVRSEATTPDQIDRLLEEERRRHVRNALAQLPEAMREALLLRYAEELRYDEMSNLLAVSESTLRSRVHHGLKLLRERLENGS